MNQTIKVALVTGASSGIGQAIATELRKQGIRVYAASRSMPDYFDQEQRSESEDMLRTVRMDVNDTLAVEKTLAKIIAAEGRLDYFVQSAGNGIAGSVEDTQIDEVRYQMETNFFGAVTPLPIILKQMRQQGSGLIVQVGSMAGVLSIPYQAYYSASKAAIASLNLALADEVRPWGIRCMLVQPGDTRTGFTQARVMTRSALESDYAASCRRSIDRMAADEQNGTTPEISARKVVRKMLKRRPPHVMSIGLFYQFAGLASRLLPLRLVRWVVRMLYAG